MLGLVGFKAAVKRSRSCTREDSVSSGTKAPYASSVSQHSISREDSVFGFTNHLSHFSTEDLPIVAAPSPFPGRRTFPGGDEGVLSDDEEEEDEKFEVWACRVRGREGC